MTRTTHTPRRPRGPSLAVGAALALVPAVLAVSSVSSPAGADPAPPVLVGRAVLPYDTFAGPPASGADYHPAVTNGVVFPLPEQPVQGFSAVVTGRRPGEYLALEDNGYGDKATSRDFLIRAYYLRPHFKTARGGSGTVAVGPHISFRDPDHLIGFPIVNEATSDRLLTGGDIDPESMQRGRHGDLWVGEEFGPWILHFDGSGRLLDPPYVVPGGIVSPNNPHLVGPATQPNSRGFEGMAITPDRKHLVAALEGATVQDAADPVTSTRRHVYELDTASGEVTGPRWEYRAERPTNLVADMWALDAHRMLVLERDRSFGASTDFRRIYLVDLRDVDADGFLVKRQLVDLAAVPDPDLVSLPAIHPGDVGLGNPYTVTCESVEAVHHISGNRLLVGCDNNLPNSGRNPDRPDDNEFITVDVPGLKVLKVLDAS